MTKMIEKIITKKQSDAKYLRDTVAITNTKCVYKYTCD